VPIQRCIPVNDILKIEGFYWNLSRPIFQMLIFSRCKVSPGANPGQHSRCCYSENARFILVPIQANIPDVVILKIEGLSCDLSRDAFQMLIFRECKVYPGSNPEMHSSK